MIQIKANQKTLHQQLQQEAQRPLCSVDVQRERSHGRETTRIARVFELSDALKERWAGAEVGVEMIRQSTRQGQFQEERHYYLASWRADAATLQARIRAHWGIENPLHWVKDVVLGEDHCSIRERTSAAVMGLVRNLVITLFRRDGQVSITQAIDRFSNNLDELLRMTEFASG